MSHFIPVAFLAFIIILVPVLACHFLPRKERNDSEEV
jgi:hypothetical protein